jgi:hypothetical protein
MTQDDFCGYGVVPFSKPRTDMRFPSIPVVRAYWEALRNGRDVPFRSEIDPRGIETALEHTFILERIAPRVARFRLSGKHLNDLMGHETRGMPLTSFFTTEARSEIEALLGRVFDGPETAELTLSAELGPGRPPLAGRLLLLPMKSDLGDISRALGCLVCEGQIGRTPRRFTIAAARVMPSGGGVRTAAPRQPVDATRGFGEAPAAFQGAVKRVAASERPYLRLVMPEQD